MVDQKIFWTLLRKNMKMQKIEIPQILVSYPGGAGGEWLGYQISQHPDVLQYCSEDMLVENNEFNRWRITPSWRAYMNDFTDWQEKVWLEEDFDGSQEWWDEYYRNLPDLESYYNKVRELIKTNNDCSIPVHRVHEAWQDQAWSELFESFKTVTIRVDDTDPDQLRLLQSNIIRKIWNQEFHTAEDLDDELKDKCRKFGVDYTQVMEVIIKFSGVVNYTDMMFAVNFVKSKNPTYAIDAVLGNLSERWNEYNIRQHWCEIPNQHVIDYGKFFLNRDYMEYLYMCDFLDIEPFDEAEWKLRIDSFMDRDTLNINTTEQLENRLWMRFSEI